MAGKNQKKHGPYKKLLSMFELQALAKEHQDTPVFLTNNKGEQALEPWFKELRFNQAYQVAEIILGKPIPQFEFEQA